MSKVVRSLPYPVLENGNLSFTKGIYEIKIEPKADNSVLIEHKIQNACLITRLISEGKAKYGCLLAIPLSGYRKLYLSKKPSQTLEWNINYVAEPPMFKPVIICTQEYKCKLSEKDDVAREWVGISVAIPKGARLALKSFFRKSGDIIGLLNIKLDTDLPGGCFQVDACTEDGFYFHVNMANDLYNFVKVSGEYYAHRKSIITHIISRCFEILVRDYTNDEEWKRYRNLKALADILESKGLPIWDDDNFLSDRVATQYDPHCPPLNQIED